MTEPDVPRVGFAGAATASLIAAGRQRHAMHHPQAALVDCIRVGRGDGQVGVAFDWPAAPARRGSTGTIATRLTVLTRLSPFVSKSSACAPTSTTTRTLFDAIGSATAWARKRQARRPDRPADQLRQRAGGRGGVLPARLALGLVVRLDVAPPGDRRAGRASSRALRWRDSGPRASARTARSRAGSSGCCLLATD